MMGLFSLPDTEKVLMIWPDRGIIKLAKISYPDLNARQKENYNFMKVSAVLADYGYNTVRLSDDYKGVDFLAIHREGDVVKVQLKPTLVFDKKYMGKELYVCFPKNGKWYLYPHDILLDRLSKASNFTNTPSWINGGLYSFR